MFDDQIDVMLDRISPHNLERIRASCEAEGDWELVEIITARLDPHHQSSIPERGSRP